MSEERTFAVIVEKGARNFSAYSPDLPGCVATGRTIQETYQNMREAIESHIAGLEQESQPIPTSTTVETSLVTVSA